MPVHYRPSTNFGEKKSTKITLQKYKQWRISAYKRLAL